MSTTVRALLAAIAVIAIAGTAGSFAHAADAPASEVQSVISGQIDALQHDDGARAYGFASPNIQAMFPSIDAFMAMVRGGYAPVYHPQQFQFGALAQIGDRLVQTVELTAADGTAWIAEYTLGRQADGSLKIEGCRLLKRPGIGA